MKITAIKAQVRNQNRVSVFLDDSYSFSLDIFQIIELKLKTGQEINVDQLEELKQASLFGKVYARAVQYCLLRPHSSREVLDYLKKKTFARLDKKGDKVAGISEATTRAVFKRLEEKKFIDDEKFARFWVENRFSKKGISKIRLKTELMKKGLKPEVIEQALGDSERDELAEIKKIIAKKSARYPDGKKLELYLMRQGFRLDDIRRAMTDAED